MFTTTMHTGHSARAKLVLLLWTAAGACILSATGCSTCRQAKRTALDEPAEFSTKKDQQRSLQQYRAWADEAWAGYSRQCPPEGSSEALAAGFRDGFVDFVYAGGTGEPPPVPPRMYWNLAWRSPDGQRAADDWFVGYRAGAQMARDGGYRQSAIVQSSLWSTAASPEWAADAFGAGYSPPGGAHASPEVIAPPQPPLPEPLELPGPQPAPRGDAPPPRSNAPADEAAPMDPSTSAAASPAADFQSALRSAAHRRALQGRTSPTDNVRE